MTINIAEFEQQLASREQAYELLTPIDRPCCHFRFSGTFLGEQVIWDAHLQTLAYYVNTHGIANQSARQFIDVGEPGVHGRTIDIGLNLPIIDHPSILKTLVMVRQYKRLAPGRREFGDILHFS